MGGLHTVHGDGRVLLAGPAGLVDELAGHDHVVARPEPGVIIGRHTVSFTRRARHLGWDVDAPILHDPQAFDGPFAPFPHQRATAAFITMNQRGYVFNDPGTGKTAATIWALRWMRRRGLIRRVLIVAPLSIIKDVWVNEISRLDPEAAVWGVHSGGKPKPGKGELEDFANADYYIINHDAVKRFEDALRLDRSVDMVVIDESTAFKNPTAARTKAMYRVVNKAAVPRRCIALTGTPTPQSPLDCYGQVMIVTPDRLPGTYGRFRLQVMVELGPHNWQPKTGWELVVSDIMQPAIRVRKEDAIHLPPMVIEPHQVPLTPEQEAAQKALVQAWQVELDNGVTITPANAAVRVSKLLQLWQGMVIDDEGHARPVNAMPRVLALMRLIDQTDGPVLVFTPYKAPQAMLARLMEDAGIAHAVVNGDTPVGRRNAAFEAFRTGTLKVLLAHPRTTSHGLSFPQCNHIIWYGPTHSVETYQQACERIARPGQERVMTITHIWATSVEKEVYNVVGSRIKQQAALLELYRRTVGGML